MGEREDEGFDAEGLYPISTVRIGGTLDTGAPFATIESAVCDVCEGWATSLWVSSSSKVLEPDGIFDVRVRRSTRVVVYACSEHSDEVADALTDELGWAVNRYNTDDLAVAVDRHGRLSR